MGKKVKLSINDLDPVVNAMRCYVMIILYRKIFQFPQSILEYFVLSPIRHILLTKNDVLQYKFSGKH